MYVMFYCKCLCCPKLGITQDLYRRIAKGLEDLAFTCSHCQAIDVVDAVYDVADDDSTQDVEATDVVDAVVDSTQDVVEEIAEDVYIVVVRSFYEPQLVLKRETLDWNLLFLSFII